MPAVDIHSIQFDPYRPGSSLLHRLDARVKLILVILSIVAVAILPAGAWPIYAVFFALSMAVAILSELGLVFYWSRSLLVVPFILSALPVLTTGEGMVWRVITLSTFHIPVTVTGIERFISIALKSWISIHFTIALVASTPFPQLLDALRAVGVPRILVSVIGLMWRYLFIFADEASRLMRARDARSGLPNGMPHTRSSLTWRAGVAGGMVGNLMLRALTRADRVYAAMLARGYDGNPHSMAVHPLTLGYWLLLSGATLCLALLTFTAHLLWR